jgi:polyisoprenoid-binding protein YceI
MRRLVLLAVPALIAAPLIAQGAAEAPGKLDPSRVAAGTYKTDPAHTLIGYEVHHFAINDYFGIFGDATGTLKIDPARPEQAKVDITIPLATGITNASAELTEHLKTADFFDVANHPTARFVSTSVKVDPKDKMKAEIAGNLTIKGVTKPVVLEAEFTGAGDNPRTKVRTIGFEAETEIKRSDFGITYGLPMVGDEVELEISVAFEKVG